MEPNLKKQINAAFIRQLEAFKQGGYRFSGSDKVLFEGSQREAFDAYLNGISSGKLEGYFEIPTGVGKTALFIAIIGCYLRATEGIPDAPRVLIHEPTHDLVIQTALSFSDFMPEIAKGIEADDEQGREIDWKESAIDVHYAGRKGALNKPKVLITTYQSQAADERKAEGRPKIHNPEDFYFIIHDEAHYLTGPKYGPAAVDKFYRALQLGVTATPEYSEDRTVANKLGHCYYHLPLNTAIERGDLCHVRPVLIQTRATTKIDLVKAKKLLEIRNGRPFTDAQLEGLLNLEARNQAIIKAYLTGSHPDTGESFLGQTGMIFAGGIRHCNDFIRDAYKVLDKPAYREVKNWLRDEGLALIAPIHSEVSKDGVEIIIGGEKKKCTKEQIKELHRQGKILLIISDQELKLGSDFPMDSFIAEAVDRFSVPDATQRMGRGFRVDRPNPRYGHLGNPNKSCAAINVIDETTHDMYKGTPHYPIHAIEILHGAVHRPPGRKEGSLTSRHFRQKPPQVSESLDELGFEFISKTDAISAVARKFKENKKEKFPIKTDEWWSSRDIARKPNGKSVKTDKVVTQLMGAFERGEGEKQENGNTVLTYQGMNIRAQKMLAHSVECICFLAQDLVKAGLVEERILPVKTDEWVTRDNLRQREGGKKLETIRALSQLEEKFIEAENAADDIVVLEHNDFSIRAQRMQSGPFRSICFSIDDLIRAGIIQETNLPPKTIEWWSKEDVRRKPDGQKSKAKRAIAHLVSEFESGKGEKQSDGSTLLPYESTTVRVQSMKVGPKQPTCFFGEDLIRAGIVREKALPNKTDEWLAPLNISHKPGGSTDRTKQAIAVLSEAFESGRGELQADGSLLVEYAGEKIHIQRMQAHSQQPICFLEADFIKAGLITSPDREDLKTKPIIKKGIAPDGDDLKRTGRSRGIVDDEK
jgi:hypothetical protein